MSDWDLDDQPMALRTRAGPLVNIPCAQECNDVAMMLIRHHKASEYVDRALDRLEQLQHDARHGARVMALVVHPYVVGAPQHLKTRPQGAGGRAGTVGRAGLGWGAESRLASCGPPPG